MTQTLTLCALRNETNRIQSYQPAYEPIIQSLLDTDFYKLTMGQFAFNRYAQAPVKYSFKNRTKRVKLAQVIEEEDLRRELDNIRGLSLVPREAKYLAGLENNGTRLFSDEYIKFLKNPQLPDYILKKENGEYSLEFPGEWARAIYWETPALAVINELYYRSLMKNLHPNKVRQLYQEGKIRLEDKISTLRENPSARFIEFGTRRRFSKDWQDYVLRELKNQVPNQIAGTSNVCLAMKYGLAPKGTMAHETFMIMSGIMHKDDEEIRASHNQVLKEWWEEYGADLSIALTDTYGSQFFFKDMTLEQAKNWKGLRQDSGNPAVFARQELDFYEQKGINPKKKFFVPSDGLDVGKIVSLNNEFQGNLITVAGWGTNLTNDLGLDSLSLVVKATESCGHGTVKLSDNPAKAIGKPEDVARFMRIFEYDPTKYKVEECRY
jgi:nicotinate phosphoribosyltransferase